MVAVFEWNDDIRYCGCYGVVRLVEHGMMVVDRVLERRLHRIVTVYEMQFGFMSVRGTFDAAFVLKMMLEEYHAKG